MNFQRLKRIRRIIAGLIFFTSALLLLTLLVNADRLRVEAPNIASEKESGTGTAPKGSISFRFAVMGDSRGSTNGVHEDELRKVMGNIKRLSPKPVFILFVGDMVDGGRSGELAYWKDIMDDYYPSKAIHPAIGNHDGDETTFSSAFPDLPQEGPTGYGRTVYYFDYGNSRFFALNSNRKHEIGDEQREWLAKRMQNNGKTYNFVFFHEPAYPTGDHVGSSLDAEAYSRDAFWDVLDKNEAAMAFVGHEHNYSRRHIDSSMDETINGVPFRFRRSIYQVTTGSVGAKLTATYTDTVDVDVPPRASYNYVIVDVGDSLVSVKAYDDGNTLIDSFTYGKSPAP